MYYNIRRIYAIYTSNALLNHTFNMHAKDTFTYTLNVYAGEAISYMKNFHFTASYCLQPPFTLKRVLKKVYSMK